MGCGCTGGPFPFHHEYPPSSHLHSLTCKTNRHWVLGTSACCCSPQPLLCGGAGVGGLCRVRQPALETLRAHGGAGCVALGLKQGKGGNDLASRTGNGLRVPVPRAVEGAETRRDSPDSGGGAARSGAALGVTLFQDAAPCGLQQDSARGPGDLSSQRGLSTQRMWKDHARVASSHRRLSHRTRNTPGSSGEGGSQVILWGAPDPATGVCLSFWPGLQA